MGAEIFVPGEAATASKFNNSLFFRAGLIATMAAFNAASFFDYICCYCAEAGIYEYNSGSSLTADGYWVVNATGGGQWILVLPIGGGGSSDAGSASSAEFQIVKQSLLNTRDEAQVLAFNAESQFGPDNTDQTRIIVVEATAPNKPTVLSASGGYVTDVIDLRSKFEDLELDFSIRKGDAVHFSYGERAENLIIGQPIIEGGSAIRLNFLNPTGSSFNLKSARSTFTIIQKGSEILNG